jgi:hypothetical protein
MSHMTGQQTAHERGLARLAAAQRIAHGRTGERPAGEYHLGTFIADTDSAFAEIDRLLGEAGMDLVSIPKATAKPKGGL